MSTLSNLSPYQISGALNFGSAPAAGDYQSAYANALKINQSNYSNILAGYQGLTGSVLGNIKDVGKAQDQAIQDTYAAQQGHATQGLISRGLGNTTIQNAVSRGMLSDREKARTGLASNMAQLYAGYQANLGSQQLGFMNSVSAPYPNADSYNRLYEMQGRLGAQNRGLGMGVARPNVPGSGGSLPARSFGGMGGVGGGMGGSGSSLGVATGGYAMQRPRQQQQGMAQTRPDNQWPNEDINNENNQNYQNYIADQNNMGYENDPNNEAWNAAIGYQPDYSQEDSSGASWSYE